MGSLTILTGCYGSGKSETAVQMALDSARLGQPTTLVDMDLVNPYFTSSRSRERLEKEGVKVVAPRFSGTGIETPSLPPEMRAALMDGPGTRIVDLGGDATGATVMGSFANIVQQMEYSFLFVLNPYRPYTGTTAEARQLMEALQGYARLRITGIVNNANMVEETEPAHLIYGDEQCRLLAGETGLPIVYHCAPEAIADGLPPLEGELIRLGMNNRPKELF